MADRIESILAMLRSEPDDPFLHYSLGMEYASAERFDDAIEQFDLCAALDDGYLAAYVEAGKCLRSAGRLEEARQRFTAGMRLATAKGESHVCDFIRQQLETLPTNI